MNYYPYYYYPIMPKSPSLFSGLLKGINFKSILSGTQKTLNLANQAIPLIKQATPIVKNARTMFQVINEFRKSDSNSVSDIKKVSNEKNSNTSNESSYDKPNNISTEGPTFFVNN